MRAPSEREAPMSGDEVRRRAVRGVVAVVSREVVVRVFGLLGNVVLARLLTPRDFGTIAFGSTLMAFGYLLANGGVGSQFIRDQDEPSAADLRALQGISFAGSFAVFTIIAAIALPIGGRVGQVSTLMAVSLPLSSLSAPNGIIAERRMLYSPSIRADILQTIVYNIVAIGLVVAGAGVWGLAIGLVVSTLVGSVTLIVLGPLGFVRPVLSLSTTRRFLAFGLAFQASSIASLLRDQAINVLAATLGGLRVLGVWSLTGKILSAILLVFTALFRVSFPAVARLIERGEDAREAVQRALSLSTAVTGFSVVAIGGAAPALVPVVFGARWNGAVDVLPWSAAGLLVAGPVATTAVSFLYAKNEPGTVLWSVIAHSLTWCAVAAALLPSVGAEALGIGWVAGCAVDVGILARALGRHRIAVSPFSVPPALAAGAAGSASWLTILAVGPTLPGLIAGLAVGEAGYLLIMLVARRSIMRDVYGTIRIALVPDRS